MSIDVQYIFFVLQLALALGELLAGAPPSAPQQLGEDENTLIVVTVDHGHGFDADLDLALQSSDRPIPSSSLPSRPTFPSVEPSEPVRAYSRRPIRSALEAHLHPISDQQSDLSAYHVAAGSLPTLAKQDQDPCARFVQVLPLPYPLQTPENVLKLSYNGGMIAIAHWTVLPLAEKPCARNVILFIGDGMTSSMVTAARMLGHKSINGKYQSRLALDDAPGYGSSMTHGIYSFITDLANSTTALYSGKKATVNGLNAYTDSTGDAFNKPKFETVFEMGRRINNARGGIVSLGRGRLLRRGSPPRLRRPGSSLPHRRPRLLVGTWTQALLQYPELGSPRLSISAAIKPPSPSPRRLQVDPLSVFLATQTWIHVVRMFVKGIAHCFRAP
ncbi:hypothetical protein BCR35DRAFT_315750 [Leucosporidium creatinivorum]|uniref:alkaline phosphatase n=1 Tax=Leucosporidium creatinivorum TaxID=106004 RepID=A0A1Y2DJM2_9BASI|nr:hypothetical protein BCR35DRAFT_315750 [Leucosporidium creatinivorum]